MTVKPNIENLKKLYMSDASLSMLCDFERVLDTMDFYVFPNWRLGELVEGPRISRYWVSCKFMWPEDRMPDPSAAKRLLSYGAKVRYQRGKVKTPIEINSPSDFRPGSHKAKMVDFPVWYVEILMPKKLMGDIKQGSVDIAGEDVDLTDLQNSMQKGLTQNSAQDQTQQNNAQELDLSGDINAQPPTI